MKKLPVRLTVPLILKFALWFAVVVALVATTMPAHAQTPNDQARMEFERGAEAYREARYEDAIEAFTRAYELDSKPALLYNIAQAYERLGDVPSALHAYRDYLRSSPSDEDRKIVETRIRNLERRLRDQGLQQVSIFSDPTGASVTLDGERVGETPWTGEVKPGRHVAVLERSGHAKTTKEFVLGADRAVDLDIALGSGEVQATRRDRVSAGAQQPKSDEGRATRVSPFTWATLGVAVAAFGTAAAFELARRGAESDAEKAAIQIDHKSSFDDMERRQTTARIFLGVGAAASIAGGVLLYLDLSSSDTTREGEHANLGIGCAAGACGLITSGRF